MKTFLLVVNICLFHLSFFQGLYEDLNVRVAPGTSSHSVLTLSERGFKNLNSHAGHGHHYVHLRVKIPVGLTREQREIIEEFAALETDTPGTVDLPTAAHTRRKERAEERQEQKTASKEESVEKEEEEQLGFFGRLKKTFLG